MCGGKKKAKRGKPKKEEWAMKEREREREIQRRKKRERKRDRIAHFMGCEYFLSPSLAHRILLSLCHLIF